eukprot:TRINITY_DN7676_c0_g2_i1.p1 TRINITY_DN7676_c0_g2~~TRINITY_DN7676_c0_g2_i1.p1  ORF type:complete len:407 (+),score=71.87 TRINITY_DN7676_c0_g2_i1:54-1274(+)
MRFILLLLFLALCLTEKVLFNGHKVIRVPLTTDQVAVLEAKNMDFWAVTLPGIFDVRVSPEDLIFIQKLGLKYETYIEDVQALIDAETEANSLLGESFFDNYHNYTDIVEYLETLNKNFPSLTKYVASIGKSINGLDIPALHIGINMDLKTRQSKPVIFISGMQHAREWISPAVVTYIITELLVQYNTNPKIKAIVDTFDFVFIPIVNPDGYQFSWTSNRLWRKNRRQNSGGSFGVDLNRNWDENWGRSGSSSTPSSDTYKGTAPFSEPETRAVSNYFLSVGTVNGAIDYHSYGQLILRPYGDSKANPPNEAQLKRLGDGMRDVIRSNSGVSYTSQRGVDLYPASGTGDGWYYLFVNPKSAYSYCIELRDTSGFILPPAQIVPTGKENLAAFIFFCEFIRDTPSTV